MQKILWHTLKIEDALKELGAAKNGLADDEVKQRLRQYGANVLPEEKRPSWFAIFWRQMRSPLVYVLFVAALITAVLQEFIDMGVILAAVVVNATIGFWQEMKADQAFAMLTAMVKHSARIRRDGQEIMIESSEVVPGDILVLHAGDRIAADARLITVFDFETNEAALTGESLPVKKHVKPLLAAKMLMERANLVFQGTTIARGKAEAVVVATGKHTAFGEIALLVHKVEDLATPLQVQLHKLAKLLGVITVFIAIGIFAIGAFQGRSPVEMFLTAVAVAVAAIPEGLLVSLTVILAIGMRGLARRNAIVKRLLAAETLGSVSVICADKTGTLTTGEMEVVEIAGDEKVALKIAVVGNEGIDPTARALLRVGVKAGLDPLKLNRAMPEIDAIIFDSARKWSATLHSVARSRVARDLATTPGNVLYVRGAPEKVIAACKLIAQQKRALTKKIEQMAERGMRIVAVAYREVESTVKTLRDLKHNTLPPDQLKFVALLGIRDPLRENTRETVAIAKGAGIRTVMITGDHAKTALAIGQEAGLFHVPPLHNPPQPSLNLREGESLVITGEQMDVMDDETLAKHMGSVSIFARVLPKHKVRIVDMFHARGQAVAMTGDGVNDAAALKAADIGVAVGSGTDVAKETADVILLDNNLKTIVGAVEGGRNIYQNIRKVVVYLLSSSFTEMILIVGSLLFGLPLAILPAQILWINLIQDSLPNMALAFDKGDPDIMMDRPRPRSMSLFDGEMRALVFGVGILTDLLLFSLYLLLLYIDWPLEYIRTMVFVGLGLASTMYIYSCRSLRHLIWQSNPFSNRFLTGTTVLGVAVLIGSVYFPQLQTILRTVPLRLIDWLPLVGLGIINIVLIELVKGVFILRKHKKLVVI